MNSLRNPFLIGRKIYLRRLLHDDLENLVKWLNDERITRFLQQGDTPPTIDKLKQDYDVDGMANHQIPFAVIDKKTNKHVGWTGLFEIGWISRYAEMRIFIGEKKFWGKGYATESQKLLIEYGFDKLNLHRIAAGTNIECVGEQKALQKLFMKKEGTSREVMYRNGKYYDTVHFGIIKNEYLKRTKNGEWAKL